MRANKKKYQTIYGTLLGGILIILYSVCVLGNDSGHSGWNPLHNVFVYMAIAIITLWNPKSLNELGTKFIYLPLISFLSSILFSISLVSLNLIKEKSMWIHSGMVAPPLWKNTYICFYIIVHCCLIMLILRQFKKK
jgi:hypothetical protein